MLRFTHFRSNRDAPDFYRDYLTTRPEEINRKLPLEQVRFVVWDTETTGLNPQQDRILSVGAVEVRNANIQVGPAFNCMVFQPQPHWRETEIQVHGILPGHPEAIREGEAMQRFLPFVGNAILVGHHVGFDIQIVNSTLARLGAGTLRNRRIDTAQLAQRLRPSGYWTQPREYSLDNLAKQYNIPLSDRHTALGDAYITALLFLKLLARLRERGLKTLGDLLR